MSQRDVPRRSGQAGRPSSPIPQRRNVTGTDYSQSQRTEEPRLRGPSTNDRAPRGKHSIRGLLIVLALIGLLIFLVIRVVIPQVGQNIHDWQHANDTLLFKATAVVGHDDSPAHPTLFLVLGANNYILVNEYPGGNMAKQRPVFGSQLFGSGTPGTLGVTLTFDDENGDHLPDLEIHFGDGGQVITLMNNPQKKDFEQPHST